MRNAAGIIIAALLLGGCATAATPLPNPHTTPETEINRAACFKSGGVWIEMTDRYICRMLPRGEPS